MGMGYDYGARVSTNPFENHDAITHALLLRLDACPVGMLSRPYLAACWTMVNGELRGMKTEDLAAWTTMVNEKLEAIGQLLEDYPPIDSEAGHRFIGALLYAIERDTRGLPDAASHVSALLFGTLDLASALRELGEPPALPVAPADPAHVAALATVGRLHWGDVSIPVLPGSQPRGSEHPVYEADDDNVYASFDLTWTREQATAFYTTWAHEEGWRHVPVPVEHVLLDIPEPTIHVAKGTRVVGISIDDRARGWLSFRLKRRPKELFDVSETAVYHPGVDEPLG